MNDLGKFDRHMFEILHEIYIAREQKFKPMIISDPFFNFDM